MIIFNDIIKQLKADQSQVSETTLRRAYDLSKRAHHGQKNRDGNDYLQHPLEVLSI